MNSRHTAFLMWAAVLLCAALFFLGDGRYELRSLNRLWDLGHLPAFALFAYMLVTRWPKLARRSFVTQLLVVLGVMALLGWSIELLQLCVGRTFSWLDLRKDLVGAAIGLVFCAPGRKELSQGVHLGLKIVLVGLILWEAAPAGRALLDETIARRQFPLLSG
ncbi:MAG: VanZ family protein, partial [Desulfobacterales bacterium]|nr:VanZ family protein [Desulfobacterales bacterium]